MKTQTSQHLIALALAAVALVASLATIAYWSTLPNQMLAEGIGDTLEEASPAMLGLRLAQLEGLQTEALPALVVALGSDRMDVARGSRNLLDAEFQRWESLPPNVASRHVEHLARLLAIHAPEYNAASREHARQLVMRILAWPIDRNEIDRTQLLVTCEIVLRTVGQSVPASLANASPLASPLAATPNGTGPGPWRPRGNRNQAALRITDDPAESWELPTEPEPGTFLPPVSEDRSATVKEPPPPRQESPRPDLSGPPLATSRPPSTVAAEPRVAFPPSSAPLRAAPIAVPTAKDLREAETIAVMRWLLVDSATTDAEAELSSRGFSATQLHVARRIVDPDPRVRLQLAQSLPNIAGNDPRPWLLWLSRDVDPNVRLATVGILATSPDPALQQRLRELASEETDANVLRVVRRALEQRGLY